MTDLETQIVTKRQVNIELLRIVAMLMIVGLHYLDKGAILPQWNAPMQGVDYFAWLLEAFFLVAVNVYVLISGYFCLDYSFQIRKVVRLWGQVAFYSIGIAVVCLATGVLSLKEVSLYRLFGYLFPITTEHYWFATAYMILIFFMPCIGFWAKQVSMKQFRWVVLGLLVFSSIAKTFIPMKLQTDHKGYDAIWFLIVCMIGVYLRKAELSKWKKISWYLYAGASLLLFLVAVGLRGFWMKTDKIEPFIGYAYSYNHVLCLLGAIGLFLGFLRVRITSEKLSGWICTISSCTFGVYLIHEHMDIRYLWPTWFHTDQMAGSLWFVPHMLGTILIVFVVGVAIEYLRKRLFAVVFQKFFPNKTI